jgi:DNA helicase-2/ATP-dependent DNA helicase PcrA
MSEYADKYAHEELNEAQRIAVSAGRGVFQVMAGPGSGKTKVIAARHERLETLGMKVLTLTLTRAAADEMRKRVEGLRTDFRTFHSLAYEVVYGTVKVPPKNIDFDELLLKAYWKLAEERARNGYKYDFVQVDEAQDCSSAEWEILRLLSANIFAVGDGLQAIYSFRGTNADLFINMQKDFPGTMTRYLSTNYRSTQAIVDYCKEIAPIRGEFLERMCSVKEQGEHVYRLRWYTNIDEAEYVKAETQNLIKNPNETTAILARTKHQLKIFEKLRLSKDVTLSTIHAAKGKEWDNVFVIGCQKGLLPHADGDKEEESRILFVACSRAKKRLFLTSYGGAA